MTYHFSGLGTDDPCAAVKTAAKESSRISLTMVRASRRKRGRDKSKQIAQLRRDWGAGAGESFDAMMRR